MDKQAKMHITKFRHVVSCFDVFSWQNYFGTVLKNGILWWNEWVPSRVDATSLVLPVGTIYYYIL
jgi:hypothetical protein